MKFNKFLILVYVVLIISINFSCSNKLINSAAFKENSDRVEIKLIKDSTKCGDYYETVYYPLLKENNLYHKKINKYIIGYIAEKWDLSTTNLKSQIKEQLALLKKCCEYRENCSIFDRGYEVLYNNENILTIEFIGTTFRGKYFLDFISFNTIDGERIDSNIFLTSKKNALLRLIDQRLQKRLKDDEIHEEIPNGKFSNLNNFYITKNHNDRKGIRFDYVFGLDVENIEPILLESDLFFSFEELKPYLKDKFIKQLGFKLTDKNE